MPKKLKRNTKAKTYFSKRTKKRKGGRRKYAAGDAYAIPTSFAVTNNVQNLAANPDKSAARLQSLYELDAEEAEKKKEHPLIVKWTPVFIEAQRDGIQIQHYKNPLTGENDITTLVFDNRVLQATAPTGTKLSTMDMAAYHQVIEQMSKQQP